MTASTDPPARAVADAATAPGPGAAALVDLATARPAEWLALSQAANWNQNEDDWRTMLALGQGWGLRQADAKGRDTLVASTLVLPYAGFAWISMVLVLPAFRGQGHARRLLAVALQALAARRLLPVLDATPAGRRVYRRQGFVDAWGFERWRRTAGTEVATAMPAGVRPLGEADWPGLARFDASAFGADRTPLLRQLAARLPQAAWVAAAAAGEGAGDAAPRGYLLGRNGRTALQLGPLVADDDDTALTLLAAALATLQGSGGRTDREIIVDLCQGRERVGGWLRARGFAVERPFTRMVHGAQAQAPGDGRRVVLVAGPELG